jgi:uncharacterized protein YwgA
MMDARTFAQLGLLALGGSVHGKTKYQKSIYFLGLMTGCVEALGYRAHYYGPYSEDVAEAMDWLRIIGAVDQSSSGVGTVDSSGFEIRRYDYRLNPRGRSFVENSAARHQDLWQKVQKAAESLGKAGDMDYASLSIAAKTYFLLDQKQGPATREELRRFASRFGWEVSPSQLEEAGAFLEKLGLIEVASVEESDSTFTDVP